jgi:sugar diacid utilization regulator
VTRSSESGDGADATIGDQHAALRALLALSMDLAAADDVAEILRLASTAVASVVGHSRTTAVQLARAWAPGTEDPPDADAVAAELDDLGPSGGEVHLEREGWSWAFPLGGLGGTVGHMVVAADAPPPEHAMFLLGLLAQHVGTALVNADQHREKQATATAERALAERLSAENLALERAVQDLERAREIATRRLTIHDRLTRAMVTGVGEEAIAQAAHELVGRPVAIEDRFGKLIAWAGPDRPDPYPKLPPPARERLLVTALSSDRPLRHGGRVLAVARVAGEPLGTIALVDPDGDTGELDLVALEHAANLLALELTRQRSVADTEQRLRGDLVGELLAGQHLEGIFDRFRAMGYDLDRPHRVVILAIRTPRGDDDAAYHAVRRAARDTAVGSLLVARDGRLAVLAESVADWKAFRSAVVAELGPGSACRAGVGGLCAQPADFARSYREGVVALNVQISVGSPEQVTGFDDLGVYGLLAESVDVGTLDRFVDRWLGPLRDHDDAKGAELVRTLSIYLECGGNYDDTARRLSIHRSSVRYRLGQIRRITGCDLADADTRFNLQFATRAWSTALAVRGV